MLYLNNCRTLIQKHRILVLILSGALVFRIVQMMLPGILSWDGSVYVGMGKYLYSGGVVGTWEVFRPVVWPLILGAFWKVEIDPYLVGTLCATAFSLAFVVLVYAVGERMKEGVGKIAAVFAATLPVLFQYSTVPMVDIPSTTCALAAIYILGSNKKHAAWYAGICTGIAFLWRFPHGLILVVLGLVIVFCYMQNKTDGPGKIIRAFSREVLFLGLGFSIVVAPFLIINMVIYGNALLPFIEGNAIIKNFPALYHKGFWFYFKETFLQHPLLLFSVVQLFFLRRVLQNRQTLIVLVALVVYGAYFLYQPHKEVRYMIAFLPYVFLLASLGIVEIVNRFKISFIAIFILIAISGIWINTVQLLRQEKDSLTTENFSLFFATIPGARIISSSPFPVRYGDIKIVKTLYNDWNDALQNYQKYKVSIDYMALDSCVLEVACEATDTICRSGKEELFAILDSSEQRVFSEKAGRCELNIYSITH